MPPTLSLSDFNVTAWAKGDYVSAYRGRDILPVEAVLVARHRDALAGSVLELGCGAGRLTRVLVALSTQVIALDVSPGMVDACAEAVPTVQAALGDLRDLSAYADGAFGAVVAANNLLDVLSDADRRAALAGIARVLTPDGVLLFSSHNPAHVPARPSLLRTVYQARHALRRRRNRRAARAFEHAENGYAIVNDSAHDHRLAHYYIRRDTQERQLAEAGLELLECLDVEGGVVPPGEDAPAAPWLHYAAAPSRTAAANASTSASEVSQDVIQRTSPEPSSQT